jgi:hypothetical protein
MEACVIFQDVKKLFYEVRVIHRVPQLPQLIFQFPEIAACDAFERVQWGARSASRS